MNAKAILVLVIGGLLLITVLVVTKPDAPVAAGPQNAPNKSVDGGQRAMSDRRDQGQPAAVPAGNIVALLISRIETLEREMDRLVPPQEITELQSRVAELERSMRDSRQMSSKSRSQFGDLAQLRSEDASLKRAHGQLASKVANLENKTTPAINDLRVLQQKVFSLETAVQRLEFRR